MPRTESSASNQLVHQGKRRVTSETDLLAARGRAGCASIAYHPRDTLCGAPKELLVGVSPTDE
jgi:predicted short-subunit dehydrogenase-like oxidoreductase (DUF2520 family)